MALTTGVTHTRIRLFNIGANRGPGDEVAIVYDAKNVGSAVMANDEGSAYWTLPINHELINQFQPLLRHYKIERLNHDTGGYDLVGAGLLTGADVTNDEVVFSGSDYMGVMNTYYTEILGASTDATSPLEFPTGGATSVEGSHTYDSATSGVARSASFINATTFDWNSHDTEIHLQTGTGGTTASPGFTFRSLLRFNLTGHAGFSSSTSIKKATLRLYGASETSAHVGSSSTGSRNLELRRATVDWTGDTTTGSENSWGNSSDPNCDFGTMNNAYEGAAATKSFTGITNNTLYEIDVTSIVQAWKSGSANHGFHIRNSGEGITNRGLAFYSTAHTTASRRPKLYIEYETNTVTGSSYDTDGLFNATTETKTYVSASRIYGRDAQLSKNSPTSPLSDRTPTAMYFLDKSSKAFAGTGKYWPTASFFPTNISLPSDYDTANPPTDTNTNRFVVKYDEENEKYIITGIARIERSAQNGSTNRWSDYINSTEIYSDFSINTVVLSFLSSPGGELFSVYLWKNTNTADGYQTLSFDKHRSVEFPFWVEVFPTTNQAIIKVAPEPAPATDTSVNHPSSGTAVGGLLTLVAPTSAQYRVPILLSGQSYEFQAMITATISDTGGNHQLRTAWVSAYNQDKSPMSLRSETLQDVVSRHLTTEGTGAFDKPPVGTVEVGRLNWATVENVSSSGWPSDKLRYFTTGENVTDFLRNISDKQMSENEEVDIEGVDVPGRTVFNFVGVRKEDGSPADGSKLYINPNMVNQPSLTLEYPGVIASFRYNVDGRRLKNDVRLIPATAYLSGSYTNMSGVRLRGETRADTTSQETYGLAQILTAQQGFIDKDDAGKAASRILEQRKDFEVSSNLTVQIERDRLNPFYDFFLGDAVRVFIRRDNVNVAEEYFGLLSGIYIISGVTYKVGEDGAEEVVLQLLNGKYFAAVAG
jgi:hypothetical protein